MSTSTSHDGGSHGSVKSYVMGLILSIVLTVIPFGMVMKGGFDETTVIVTIVIMAVLQVLLQLILFMHMNLKTQEGRDSGSFVFFTAVILTLIIGGTVWIMYHLNINLM
ncbi:cytochrome o ubiquinol oxidase subunit IV [Marinobacter koreensis]|jgi:cytochrome o ubiquinol oxidase operon protein cyoD|uniref:Cytochrome bo(3) ubiquinol oxidase subunit 4 n=1 Tax=Marinobacter koreensis TaxID=335974 RepID=A0ABW0RRP4_9GAMM|nr:cytochrome o ubiquinol oxidase subunit IV [Marinobacter koreensis]MCK7549575.1 cytochrome o ubiquinol oxidase subunit IV [Marinobacter koreensis]MDX1817216.1 cytochrome o ubiquinol oxidase subunit IV [Marinobacter sp.]